MESATATQADLPTMIASIFEKVKTGVLYPILQGTYGILPVILFIGIIVCILMLIFSERKGAKVASLVLLLAIAFLFTSIPDLLAAFTSYFGGGQTGAIDSTALSGAQDAAQTGVNEALGQLNATGAAQ